MYRNMCTIYMYNTVVLLRRLLDAVQRRFFLLARQLLVAGYVIALEHCLDINFV